MERDGGFDSWLVEELVSRGLFERAKLEIYAARARRMKIPLHSWLTAEGLLDRSAVEEFRNRWRAEGGGDAPVSGLPGPGEEIAGYRILSLIGYGGMGVVYRAVQTSLNRTVALKLLKPDRRWDKEHRRRFLNEARIASELNHENIVKVYEVGEDGDVLFFSMELIEGEDLQQLVQREGRLSPSFVRAVLVEVSRALEAAHRKGIVHGDVKPANILLSKDGKIKLADLGIAVRRLEKTSKLFASIHYAAPEIVRGRPPSPAADLYSLGATAWHLLTGRPPFSDMEKEAITAALAEGKVPDIEDVMPSLPVELLRAVRWLMAPSPADRPVSAAELAAFLSKARRYPSRSRRTLSARTARTSSPVPFLVAIGVLIVAAGGWYIFTHRGRSGPAPTPVRFTATPLSSGPASLSPSPTPSPTVPPSIAAARLYDPTAGNYGEVLAFIANALPASPESERKELLRLRDTVLAERKQALEVMTEKYRSMMAEALGKGDYAKAVEIYTSFSPPAEWGYTLLDPEPARARESLRALISQAVEHDMKRVLAAVGRGDFAAASAVLSRLRSLPLPEFAKKIAALSVRVEQERERAALEAKRKAEPLFRRLLSDVLEAAGRGDMKALDKLLADAERDPVLRVLSDRVRELSSDLEGVRAFFSAFEARLRGLAASGERIAVELAGGARFEGKVVQKDGAFRLVFTSRGVQGSLKLAPNALALSTVERLAREGGCPPSALSVARPLLLASRNRWEEAWAALESLGEDEALNRWFARLSMLSNPTGGLFSDKKKHEDEARDLYARLVRAFEAEDWKTAADLASRLLSDYPTSVAVREHRRTIEEMAKQAEAASPAASEPVRREFDFTDPAVREDFFYRGFGGDIGELGFGRRGEVFVARGEDGLLLLKRPVGGEVTVEFEMRIEKGSELRVCLHDAVLGAGIVFDDAAFGPYESLRKAYRKGGRKVTMKLSADGLHVVVDGKQEALFASPSRPNDYLAFYFLGRGVKLTRLAVTASFGPPVRKPDELLAAFDVIRFADIRSRDLKR